MRENGVMGDWGRRGMGRRGEGRCGGEGRVRVSVCVGVGGGRDEKGGCGGEGGGAGGGGGGGGEVGSWGAEGTGKMRAAERQPVLHAG